MDETPVEQLIDQINTDCIKPGEYWPARTLLEIARQLERLEATLRTAAAEYFAQQPAIRCGRSDHHLFHLNPKFECPDVRGTNEPCPGHERL